jgi:polysaccharide pyruvyl transferase WcaK-like protein
MPIKIVVSGWYGTGNIGDEAILHGLIKIFQSQWDQCDITVLSFKPDYTIQTQQVKAVWQLPENFRRWIKSILTLKLFPTIKAISECDLFVLGGGGFLSDWQPEVPFQWLSQARIAKLFGKETMLYGIGAGPFKTKQGQRFTKKYIDKYIDSITVRDIYSYSALINDVGIKEDKVRITNDPAFSLTIQNNLDIRRKNVIGINFVELFKFRSFTGGEKKFQRYVVDLKEIIRIVQMTFPECDLEFVPLFKKDIDFFMEYFSAEFPTINIINIDSYTELVNRLYSYKLFVGTRFHSIVFAIMTKTPLVGIVYHPKSLAVCNNFEIDYSVISDGSFPPLEEKDLDLEEIKSGLLKINNLLRITTKENI